MTKIAIELTSGMTNFLLLQEPLKQKPEFPSRLANNASDEKIEYQLL